MQILPDISSLQYIYGRIHTLKPGGGFVFYRFPNSGKFTIYIRLLLWSSVFYIMKIYKFFCIALSPPVQLLMSTPPTSTPASGAASPCCENGRPIMTDPHTGQTICSCQYPAGLLAAYSRVPGLADGVYPSPYAAPGLMSLGGADPSAFYPPVVSIIRYGLSRNIYTAVMYF